MFLYKAISKPSTFPSVPFEIDFTRTEEEVLPLLLWF
jgi:hypothetical protein